MSETSKIEELVEFAENPEPRCPCILLLDTSGSMQGPPIDALNNGLMTLKSDLVKDPLASRRVEVAIITFDNIINVAQDFITADKFKPPILTAQGQTFMGTAINTALDMIQSRKAHYRANGIAYYRPWIFMITDGESQGEPLDIMDQATRRINDDEANKRVAFFAVGVENANMERLQTLSVRAPVKLIGLNFTDMFIWLSRSTQAVSHSKMDDQVALPPPGWATV
jgi:uncharacterized protein YegL